MHPTRDAPSTSRATSTAQPVDSAAPGPSREDTAALSKRQSRRHERRGDLPLQRGEVQVIVPAVDTSTHATKEAALQWFGDGLPEHVRREMNSKNISKDSNATFWFATPATAQAAML